MNATSKVVLIVDDEPGIRDMLRWCLRDRGFEIKTARDGEEALRVLRDGGVDLVVTDLTMPRLDGFQLLESAKAAAPGLAIIVITGFATVEMAVFAMRKGAADVLLKPVEPRHLVARIDEIFWQRRFHYD